jgi:predicted RNase H-like HicB family nuclease
MAQRMERTIRLHIERLPEGVYLATSGDLKGLVTQAPSLGQCIEWAQENARILLELQGAKDVSVSFVEHVDLTASVKMAA